MRISTFKRLIGHISHQYLSSCSSHGTYRPGRLDPISDPEKQCLGFLFPDDKVAIHGHFSFNSFDHAGQFRNTDDFWRSTLVKVVRAYKQQNHQWVH